MNEPLSSVNRSKKIGLRKRLQNNVILVIIGSLSAGFIIGMIAYENILKMNEYKIVSQEEFQNDKKEKYSLQEDNVMMKNHILHLRSELAKTVTNPKVEDPVLKKINNKQAKAEKEKRKAKREKKLKGKLDNLIFNGTLIIIFYFTIILLFGG